MTLGEFKAWLEGFENAFSAYGNSPSTAQWAEIKKRLLTVGAQPPQWDVFEKPWPSTSPIISNQRAGIKADWPPSVSRPFADKETDDE